MASSHSSNQSLQNLELIHTFYTHFKNLNAEGMIACYHPDVHFCDPVFQDLHGEQVFAMWQMLCAKALKFELEYADVQANEYSGSAHWKAKYNFAATGRHVENKILAKFDFVDGKIIKHHDNFSLWRWSRMALGTPGVALGWSPIIRKKVRKTAQQNLHNFIAAQNDAAQNDTTSPQSAR